MKSGITRWKIVPSYSLALDGFPVRGSVHSRVPSARSTKFRTVLGAWSGNSRTVTVPRFVRSFAVSVFVMKGILARPASWAARRPGHGTLSDRVSSYFPTSGGLRRIRPMTARGPLGGRMAHLRQTPRIGTATVDGRRWREVCETTKDPRGG